MKVLLRILYMNIYVNESIDVDVFSKVNVVKMQLK